MDTKRCGFWFVSLVVIFSMLFPMMMKPTPAYATVDVTPVLGGILRGTETRITADLSDQMDPAISGDIIVYTDYRGTDANIWYYNLATSTEQPATTSWGDQVLNDVSGVIITYDDYSLGDVFIYDTAYGTYTNITGNEGQGGCAQEPAIGGTLLAWAHGGDIYAKDLATGEERRITASPASDRAPAVAGGIIVWQSCDPTCHIYAYDWATGILQRITNTLLDERDPDIWGQAVVYSGRPATGGAGDIYYYDLATGVEKRLLLPADQANPNISGDYIAFEDMRSGKSHISVWHVPTGTVFDLNIPTTSGQFLNDIDSNRIVYTDDRGGQFDIYLYEFTWPEPDIEVNPLVYSFGDVTVGTTSDTVVTITNTGDSNLTITDIGDPCNFFWYKVSAGLNSIPPGGTGEIYVYFFPQSPGPSSYTLMIYSNDPDEGLVEVALSGNGVSAEIPPSEQIANILEFFDDSVVDGTLVGSGPGNSAQGRLKALRNMIEAAGTLIEQGRFAEALQQLQDAYLRVDGNPKPPDFVTGTAAAELASMIQQLINSLGG